MQNKKLHILYITQYFYPEVGATQTRAYEMARNLVKQGHRVTVLTEFPNHPKGIIPEKYRGRFWEHEKYHGIDIVRTWVWTRPEKTFVTRMAFYLTFMLTAAIAGTILPGQYDVVYTTSPPFFVGLTGYWLSRFKKARFVFEIRDIWPQSAVELGELNNPRFIRWAEQLEHRFYTRAAAIIPVTQGITDEIHSRGYDSSKVHLVTNGTNTELFQYRKSDLKKTLGFEGKFVVLYAGIFGIAQGMDHLLEVVESLKSETDIQFVFIGEGPKKADVVAQKEARSLDNLTILDEISRDVIPDYISMSDCCLVPLRKIALFQGALPSKMFDTMACERPIILSIEGEAQTVLEKAGGGLSVEPENVEAMAGAVLKLKQDAELCRLMGRRGRAFVEAHFSRRQKALELEEVLLGLFG